MGDDEPFSLIGLMRDRHRQLGEAETEYVARLRAVDDLRVRLVAAETELAVARDRVARRRKIISNALACQAVARIIEAANA